MLQILLLCGPPGLGKTTLAHVAARHCGYRVVEVVVYSLHESHAQCIIFCQTSIFKIISLAMILVNLLFIYVGCICFSLLQIKGCSAVAEKSAIYLSSPNGLIKIFCFMFFLGVFQIE